MIFSHPLALTHGQSLVAYYGETGYTGFGTASTYFDQTTMQLELRFKFCSTTGGLLLYMTDSTEQTYFAVGVTSDRQLHVETNLGNRVGQVSLEVQASVCAHGSSARKP